MSGKNTKPNLQSREESQLPAPPTGFHPTNHRKHQRLYTLLSMELFCKSTDAETAVRFLEQYNNLNGIPESLKTDKWYAFTG